MQNMEKRSEEFFLDVKKQKIITKLPMELFNSKWTRENFNVAGHVMPSESES